jgi:hypothetical protein
VVGSCERHNEPAGSINEKNFLTSGVAINFLSRSLCCMELDIAKYLFHLKFPLA